MRVNRERHFAANTSDTIDVAAGTYTQSRIDVGRDVTICGIRASGLIVQAAAGPGIAADRVFGIAASITATSQNMTIFLYKRSIPQ